MKDCISDHGEFGKLMRSKLYMRGVASPEEATAAQWYSATVLDLAAKSDHAIKRLSDLSYLKFFKHLSA